MKTVIYAMVGTIGSGKTTLARKIAAEKRAMFFSIDESVNQLGTSVVFDFGGSRGHWDWLRSLAAETRSEIEIFHLKAPIETRRERVRNRNANYFFQFSDEEFNSMPAVSATPDPQPGLKITEIDNGEAIGKS